MLRLLLEASAAVHGGLPFDFAEGATWYSEARLPSAFAHRRRADPLAESPTHADGVVGHFIFRPGTKAGLVLAEWTQQFMVIEAKMNSRLASGTTNASFFDQAARNVAAMAWTVHESTVVPSDLESIGFYVIAPRDRIESDPTFHEYTSVRSIEEKVERRLAMYSEDQEATERLTAFFDQTLVPLLGRMDLEVVAWEKLLGETGDWEPTLRSFYADCLQYN